MGYYNKDIGYLLSERFQLVAMALPISISSGTNIALRGHEMCGFRIQLPPHEPIFTKLHPGTSLPVSLNQVQPSRTCICRSGNLWSILTEFQSV